MPGTSYSTVIRALLYFLPEKFAEIFAWSSGVEWSMKSMPGGGKRNVFVFAFQPCN